jgi:ABC-type transport system involved in Fe-S cluster assembly fused permease/ATPase subunit
MLPWSDLVVAVKARCKSRHFTVFKQAVESVISIQLLERFYDPLSGRISLDGQLVDEFNIQAYRQQISLVSQEPVSTIMILVSW